MVNPVEWYWPDYLCRNGHISPRRVTDGRCVECVRSRTNNYVGSEKEKTNHKRYDQSAKGRAAKSRYRSTEKRKIVIRRYSNSEKGRLCKYRSNHSDSYKIARKRFSLTDKGKACAIRNSSARRARIKLVTHEPYSYDDRISRFAQFNNLCAYCGSNEPLTEDHFVPIAVGGHHSLDNIVPACKSCNVRKNATPPEEWYPKQSFFSMNRWQFIQTVMGIL
jgi:5-methylcytosine-specific restriction endonuclease McrA